MNQKLSNYFNKIWYKSNTPVSYFFLPFSWIYLLGLKARYFFHRYVKRTFANHDIFTIIVGNLTVGGTGKTPFVIYLTNLLQKNNFKVAILSRGYYGKRKKDRVVLVDQNSSFLETGDEPQIIFAQTKAILAVGDNRVKTKNYLINNFAPDILISDDGLQNYSLNRNLEIILVDAKRLFGNGHLLPSGPLREPIKNKLRKTKFIIYNRKNNQQDDKNFPYQMAYRNDGLINLKTKSVGTFSHFLSTKVHAVTGIGDSESFFQTLRQNGLDIIPHSFPDHHLFQKTDFNFSDDLPIIMTEKDSVKCYAFAKDNFWYLKISVVMSDNFDHDILEAIKKAI